MKAAHSTRTNMWSACASGILCGPMTPSRLAAIDAVAGDQPVALSSADMHCGWVNSAAARKLGVDVDESGLVGELEWFDATASWTKDLVRPMS